MGDYIIELIEVLNIRDQMKEEWSRRSRPSRRVCQQHINIKVQHQKTTLGKIISMMLTLKGRFQEYARSWLHGECTRRSHDSSIASNPSINQQKRLYRFTIFCFSQSTLYTHLDHLLQLPSGKGRTRKRKRGG